MDDLARLLEQIIAPLTAQQKQTFHAVLAEQLADDLPAQEALTEALFSQVRGAWVLMQVDWKAIDEVEWQAQELAKTWGLTDRYEQGNDVESVAEALEQFGDWLSSRGFRYLWWNQQSDMYLGMICPESATNDLFAVAKLVDLDISERPC